MPVFFDFYGVTHSKKRRAEEPEVVPRAGLEPARPITGSPGF